MVILVIVVCLVDVCFCMLVLRIEGIVVVVKYDGVCDVGGWWWIVDGLLVWCGGGCGCDR